MQLNPRAWDFLIPLSLLTVATALVGLYPLTLATLVFAGGICLFFRDPDRSPPETGIVAPADGRVTVIREEDNQLRLGIFMNVYNVHVIRSPLTTQLHELTHKPGGHLPAFHKDSERNERLQYHFDDLTVELIAGVLVRRTHSYINPTDTATKGERIGHIDFGSRVDVVLPEEYTRDDLTVEKLDKVTAGETQLVS